MPKISKARIVNFTYNDGNRLIADEVFDFSNDRDDDALNVLISLANGGGKSVLVQLLMQPVIPKARVAGRKIESFFGKLTDHCFVVLEWMKDDSREKLLTGIAIAAREISSTEEETSGGMGIKYYTFYGNYSSDASDCSLINLPLSSKQNGRFIPAEYEAIKKFSRKNRGQLEYYASDDGPRWQRKLEEYGLFQAEWRMIEKLNSEEGGLGKFFGEFRTSDQLVDRLLIPTIEGKLKPDHGKEDGTLVTMLLSHARQYAGQKDKLREKQSYEEFLEKLEVLQPMAEDLGNQFYHQEERIGRLFGLLSALQRENRSVQGRKEAAEHTIDQMDEEIRRICWEKKSAEYYACQERYLETEKKWTESKSKTDLMQDQRDRAEQDLKIQECADYERQRKEAESKARQLEKDITGKEQGLETSGESAALGYSAAKAMEEAMQQMRPELEQVRAETEKTEDSERQTEAAIGEIQKAVQKAQSDEDQVKGRLSSKEEETDREIESLECDMVRRLDGSYETEELEELGRKIGQKLTENKKKQEKLRTEKTELEARRDEIPQKLADLSSQIHDAGTQIQKLQEDLEQYDRDEALVRAVCDAYNLDFSGRFTDRIGTYIREQEQAAEAQMGDIRRRISLAEEEIRAAQTGYLHVPKGVIDYLNSTGVRYSTCERYMLDLVNAGKLSRESCLKTLEKYPAAAYGILMTEDQISTFFSYERIEWLPAMIPIFTYAMMDRILNNEKTFSGAIAFYSEAYFADQKHYIEEMIRKQRELQDTRDLLEQRIERFREQLEQVKAFDYSADWKDRKKQKIEMTEDRKKKMEKQREQMEREKQTVREKLQLLEDGQEQIRQEQQKLSWQTDCLQRIRIRLQEEQKLTQDLSEKMRERKDLEEKLSLENQTLQKIKDQAEGLRERLKGLNEQLERLEAAYAQVRGKTSSERIAGSWEELYHKYQSCIQNENTELEGLRQQLKDWTDREKQVQKEIRRRELSEELYQGVVYSEELAEKLRRTVKELDRQLTAQEDDTRRIWTEYTKAQSRVENAQENLKDFGKPLEKSQIGADFDRRTAVCRETKNQQQVLLKEYGKQENALNTESLKLEQKLSDDPKPDQVPEIALEEEYQKQCADALEQYRQGKKELEKTEKDTSAQLAHIKEWAPDDMQAIRNAVSGMTELLQNETRGDRYFTLSLQIDSQIQNTERAISQITTDLKEFENSRSDLVQQCKFQGKQIYEGLKQMEASSRVTVYAGKPRQRMIRFDFPDNLDETVAEQSIAAEIDQGTRDLVGKLEDREITDTDRKRFAEKIVGSPNLFRKFLGRDSIQVRAYKIDQNPENSGYRKWKETQINNSGAEKFVVYFAVILSLINYTRGSMEGIQDKELRSVLILDNPFGATSSRHILIPMFEIAKHFRVQMICLSDINKTDVINCFDIVIKAIIKQRPMSNRELLTHEGNEQIDHGYYRSEQIQMSLL